MTLHRLLPAFALATLIITSGCQPQPAAETFNDTSAPLVKVGDQVITQALLDQYARNAGFKLDTPEARAEALASLQDLFILAAKARQDGVQARPEFVIDLHLTAMSKAADALMAAKIEGLDLSDEALRQRYDTQHQRAGEREFKVSHLHFRERAGADQALVALAGGESFDALLKRVVSVEAGVDGRDLGWVEPAQFPPALGDALKALEAGQYTPAVVESEFGFHLMQVAETRPLTPPAFDEVKAGIRQTLIKEAQQRYLEELRSKAQITPIG